MSRRGLLRAGPIYWEVRCLVEAQPLNVNLIFFHGLLKNKKQITIFENLISINECNFKFANVEAARTIISAMKSSMRVSLFQWSHVSRYSKWKLIIDAWFKKFRVNIYLNNFLLLLY